MSKHTPTPWVAWKRGNIGPNHEPEIWIGIDHPEYGELSHVTVRAGCDEAEEVGCMEANAAHIVKCVNMHDELVEALRAAIKLHRIYSCQEQTREQMEEESGKELAARTFEYHDWLRALLAKAEAE